MAQAQVILHTGVKDIDPSIRSKTFMFMTKVQEDDSRSGLDIKIPTGAIDNNVRTARVDKFWRAVMFRLQSSSNGMNHYVLIGVYPHDKAYEVASRLSLTVNPVNGVTELRQSPIADVAAAPVVPAEDATGVQPDGAADAQADEASSVQPATAAGETEEVGAATSGAGSGTLGTQVGGTADAGAQPAPAGGDAPGGGVVPAVGEKHVGRTLARIGRDVLVDQLGLEPLLVDVTLQMATVDELLEMLSSTKAPEWQADVLLDLAAGASADEVALKMSFREESPADLAMRGAEVPSIPADAVDQGQAPAATQEDALIAGLHTEAAKLSFAVVQGEEELRAAIEDGSFAAWRVFLHPEQRRWAQRDYNGSFRLAGGAGTGKTVVLVHRAVRLQREARATAGARDARILLTTFTTNLADELKTQVQTLEPKALLAEALGDPGIHIAGLDRVASSIIRGASESEIREATTDVLGRPRSAVSDVTRKTPDDAWADALAVSGVDLPARGDGRAFVRSEYELVVLGNRITQKAQYLKVRRPNRGVRLSRGQRADVWAVIEAYQQQAYIDSTTSFEEKLHLAAAILRARAERADSVAASGEERDAAYAVDHVLVDEGQDLTVGHLFLLRALVRKKPNDIFLAEDSHQRIYGQKIVLSHYGIDIRGRARRLTLNYRTTERNLRFGLGILEGTQLGELFRDEDDRVAAPEEYEDLEGGAESRAGYRSLRAGEDPILEHYESAADELDGIAAHLRAWLAEGEGDPSLKPEHLAVLVRNSYLRESIVRGLAERGVDVREVDRKGVPAGKPVVMTMHRAKGTEFRNVILAGISRKSIPAGLTHERYTEQASREVDQRERSLLYVAATRARDRLVVSRVG